MDIKLGVPVCLVEDLNNNDNISVAKFAKWR